MMYDKCFLKNNILNHLTVTQSKSASFFLNFFPTAFAYEPLQCRVVAA